MTKNQRKIKLWGLSTWGFTDDFNPNRYTKNWDYFQKYVDRKEKTLYFNQLFRPLYKKMLKEEIDVYINGGHKLSSALKKELTADVKFRAKEIVKAQLAAQASPKQDQKEQQGLLAEG